MFDNFHPGAAMTTSMDLKSTLLEEIKHEEWKKSIDKVEYTNNSNLIEELCKTNFQIVSQQNKNFKPTKSTKNAPTVSRQISVKARDAYQRWKEQNQRRKKCPEVSVQNLLLLIHYLNTEPEKNSRKELDDCLKRQNLEFESFWDSPSYILKMLRTCVLTRDWQNMTLCLLILLNYGNKYLHVVKNMCRIMVKFNPLIKEYDLEEQFLNFIQESEEKLVVV